MQSVGKNICDLELLEVSTNVLELHLRIPRLLSILRLERFACSNKTVSNVFECALIKARGFFCPSKHVRSL